MSLNKEQWVVFLRKRKTLPSSTMDLFYGDVHRLVFPHMPLPDYEKHICYMFLQLIHETC